MSTRVRSACDECGWVGKWTSSPARADYAYRRHSCAKQRRDAARRRRVARRKALDGPVRECEHKIARHRHGTHAAYVLDRCKCKPCRTANSTYEQQRTRDRAYGRPAYVDADAARAHVKALAARGVGPKSVTKPSGISHGSMTKLIYGDPRRGQPPSQRIRPDTERKILAVTIDMANGGQRIDATGTRRRLQALTALGYPAAALARMAGIDRQVIDAALAARRAGTTAATAAAARRVYDRVGDRQAQPRDHAAKVASARARNRAIANRWPRPAMWDDEQLDDPAAAPAQVGTCPEQPCERDRVALGLCTTHYARRRRDHAANQQAANQHKDQAA